MGSLSMPVDLARGILNQGRQQQGDQAPAKLVVQISPALQLAIAPQQGINQSDQVADLVKENRLGSSLKGEDPEAIDGG
jgi:hypothetical protein